MNYVFLRNIKTAKNVLSCRTWRHTSKIEITKTKRTEILHSVLFCCLVSLLFNFYFKHSRKQWREKFRRMYNNDFHTMLFLKVLPQTNRLVIMICPALISVNIALSFYLLPSHFRLHLNAPSRKIDYQNADVSRADTAYS